MFVPYRNIYIIAGMSVMLVVLATIIKITESVPPGTFALPQSEERKERSGPPSGYPVHLDYDFYATSASGSEVSVKGAIASDNNQNKVNESAPQNTGQKEQKPASSQNSVQNTPDPITAKAYLVGNVKTGDIYLERSSAEAMPVASMSKLVTAFVATETLDPDLKIEITEEAVAVPPDRSNLQAGEMYTSKELLYPLLLSSSNVAAEALASRFDRAKFLELMSSYAWEIGMPTTYFADPSGVSPSNKASARDIFALSKYLYSSRPDILALTKERKAETATTSEHLGHDFVSTHPFVDDPRFIGGKTGRTPEAGDTMMTILNIQGHPVAIIVIGSEYESRAVDTTILANRIEKALAGIASKAKPANQR